MKKWLVIVAAAAFATVASAQNSHAFKEMDGFVDVFITGSGTTWNLSLGANPTVIRNGKASSIKDVDGFWVISDHKNLGATGSAFGEYKWMSNTPGSGANSTFGWQTQKKNGITAGGSQTFTFDSLDASGIDAFGLKLHANGIPAHVRFNNDCPPVPEPASMLALMSGCAVLVRKRFKKK